MTSLATTLRVSVAVLTYRRPVDLASCLPLLVQHATDVGHLGAARYEVDIVVVDNDPEASALQVVAQVADSATVGVRYLLEPTPGIAAARNRALTEAKESDLLVFIDDDERPHEGWLRQLLLTQEECGAIAVAGRVVSEFEVPPDPWLTAGEFFTRQQRATGDQLDVAATNNLLIDLRVVRRLGLQFDLAFGLTGGEDTLFTRTLARSGGPMVWCNEAVVTDRVPATRLTRTWVLRRAFSSGNSMSRVQVRLADGYLQRLLVCVTALRAGVPRLVGGAGRYLLGVVTGIRRHQAKGLRTLARGAGMICGAFGYAYQEYRRG